MITKFPRSYLTVHYGLRPAKQVERRMFIDAFQLLSEVGFLIRKYLYIGMGSIHFIDFALFHKYFGIHDMLSVEISAEIDKRIKFNVPFQNVIRTETGKPIGDFLSDLDADTNYLVWLDYDNVLRQEMIRDVSLASSKLASGSILLITVDTETPVADRKGEQDSESNLLITREYYESIASNYLYPPRADADFSYELIPRLNIDILNNVINSTIITRDLDFVPLFCFLYADGHRMLTIGGMFANKRDKQKLNRCDILNADYVRTNLSNEPFFIKVPLLTRKEQLHLDSDMPCDDEWEPGFELSKEEIESYRLIYRFYPAYAELLL